MLEWRDALGVGFDYSVFRVVAAGCCVLSIIWLARLFGGFGFNLPLWKFTKGRRNG